MLSCLKNVGNSFSFDICILHPINSKNVDHNIGAHTWHSVSVMGHKQGFDSAVPEFKNANKKFKIC